MSAISHSASSKRTGARLRSPLIAILAIAAIVSTSAPALAVAGDITWSRLSGMAGLDAWHGVAAYRTSVYAAGHHNRSAVIRRYNRDGSFTWTRRITPGGSTFAEIKGIAANRYGVFVAGVIYRHGEVEDPVYSDGRAFIANYRRDGSQRWLSLLDFGDSSVGMGIDVAGEWVYLVGQVNVNEAFGGAEESFVQRYNQAGYLDWTRRLRYSGTAHLRIPLLSSIAATSAGVYVSGWAEIYDADGYHHVAMVRKYALDSIQEWTDFRLIESRTSAVSIAADATGEYVVARAWSSVEIDDEWYTTKHGAFLWRYDPDGSRVWQRRVTAPSSTIPGAVAVGPGGVWVTGTAFARLADQPPGTVGDPNGDAFLVNYSREGALGVTRQYASAGTQRGEGLAVDTQGVYLSGEATEFGAGSAAGDHDGLLLGLSLK